MPAPSKTQWFSTIYQCIFCGRCISHMRIRYDEIRPWRTILSAVASMNPSIYSLSLAAVLVKHLSGVLPLSLSRRPDRRGLDGLHAAVDVDRQAALN